MLQPCTPSNLKLPALSSARSAPAATGNASRAGSRRTLLPPTFSNTSLRRLRCFCASTFWVSLEGYLRARESPVYEPLFQLRHDMAAATIELGVFAFPAPVETDAVLPQMACLCSEAESRGAR
jgi:hypothetical protein